MATPMRLEVVLHSFRSASAAGASAKPPSSAAAALSANKFASGGTAGTVSSVASGIDQDGTEIVDVCLRGATDDEPAGSLEEAGGIVSVQELLGVQVACPRQRC